MSRYNAENERVKRNYVAHLRLAKGKQEATIDGALKAIDRFERSTGLRSFKSFHVEQAKAFRERLLDQPRAKGKNLLSAATMTSTLRNLKAFFIWLAERTGYKSRISFADADILRPPPPMRESPAPAAKAECPPSSNSRR